ncbi:hypothetical protein O0L34_g7040 [Tuta absoluta]|nr:hypothetical protein O0L34_g7040 [Tuta absoluta]
MAERPIKFNALHKDELTYEVKGALVKAHERNAKYYNKGRRDEAYQVGDLVWKKTFKQSSAPKYFSAKLAPKFERCKVIRRFSPLVYELEDENGKNVDERHIRDLKAKDLV